MSTATPDTRRPQHEDNDDDGSLTSRLGPGLITGAADDDPSGIATYSQAGAQFGFGAAYGRWSSPAADDRHPARQRAHRPRHAARPGGQHPPASVRRLLYVIVILLLVANTINIAADIGAMGEALAADRRRLAADLHRWSSAPGRSRCRSSSLRALRARPEVADARPVRLCRGSLFVVGCLARGAARRRLPAHHLDARTTRRWSSRSSARPSARICSSGRPRRKSRSIRRRPRRAAAARPPNQAREQLARIKLDTYVGMGFSNLVAFCIIARPPR